MMNAIPPEATGLWRRRHITRSDGRRDSTTRVVWLQTRRHFADLRVPADRPTAAGFADYAAEDLPALTRMQGFAGTFEVEDRICRWRRVLDFHPPGGMPDEAHFHIEGDILVETGIHAGYEEIWHRQTPSGADLAAFDLVPDAPAARGLLVLAGDHFIAVADRRPILPPDASLADLLAGAADPARADDLLGMLIAYGRIGRAGGMLWQVELSTFPWLEGQSLAGGGVRFGAADGILALEAHDRVVTRWRLIDSSCRPERLGEILAARA
jgi:hypothetical protein